MIDFFGKVFVNPQKLLFFSEKIYVRKDKPVRN